VFVERIDVVDSNSVTGSGLYTYIKDAICVVSGDFRQTEILHGWTEALRKMNDVEFKTVTLRISCGSGVYVRSIAHELGIALGVPALALKIVRTKIGDYTV
jgi:tRNA U55 pseudouridine synthase TruB